MNARDQSVRRERVRLVKALDDISIALSAADFLWHVGEDEPCSRVELQRYRCYEQAAVVAYGRLFGEARGLPRFSFRKVGIQPSAPELALHNELMEMRNKVIAHADVDRLRVRVLVHSIPIKKEDIFFAPQFLFDESVTFVGKRAFELIEWLRELRHATRERIYTEIQADPSAFEFHVDHRDSSAPGLEPD